MTRAGWRHLGLTVWLMAGGCGTGAAPLAPTGSVAPGTTPVALEIPSPRAAAAQTPVRADREPPDLHVRCADRRSCPEAVGMLVSPGWSGDGAGLQRCTASLIAPDRALTAAHCLAPTARHAGAACDDVWLGLPETAARPAEWVGCRRVVFAAAVDDVGVLRQDLAMVELARPVAREPLQIDAAPLRPGAIVQVASVTPHPAQQYSHTVGTRLCRTESPELARAALGPGAARVGWLSRCAILHGNSGSPVLDYDGRLRAVVHGGTARASAVGVTSRAPVAGEPPSASP